MKIAVFVADNSGCGYYRATLPYSSLKGHDVRFFKGVDTRALYWADVLVFQRVDHPDVIARMREGKNHGKKVILDFDDLLHWLSPANPCSKVFGEGKPATKNFEVALSVADIVTCSTQPLADEYKRFRDDIMVCENFVSDTMLEQIAPKEITGELKRPPQVRIGYVGSPTHAGDVASISQPLVNIAKQYPEVKYVFFGQEPQLPGKMADRIEYHPPIGAEPGESASAFMLRYYQKILSLDLDIAVAPLKANPFNACKSAVKMLELGMCGIPIVASFFGPYKDYFAHRGYIITASGHEAWVDLLAEYVASPSMRKIVSRNNLYCVNAMTTPAAIKQWEAVLNATA